MAKISENETCKVLCSTGFREHGGIVADRLISDHVMREYVKLKKNRRLKLSQTDYQSIVEQCKKAKHDIGERDSVVLSIRGTDIELKREPVKRLLARMFEDHCALIRGLWSQLKSQGSDVCSEPHLLYLSGGSSRLFCTGEEMRKRLTPSFPSESMLSLKLTDQPERAVVYGLAAFQHLKIQDVSSKQIVIKRVDGSMPQVFPFGTPLPSAIVTVKEATVGDKLRLFCGLGNDLVALKEVDVLENDILELQLDESGRLLVTSIREHRRTTQNVCREADYAMEKK